jgi:carbon starvation protein
MRVWVKARRSPEPLPLTEAPYEESTLFAPSGLIPTPEEKAQMAGSKPGGG